MLTPADPHIPESPEVRAFAASRSIQPRFGKTWHGTRGEAMRLRRAIHRHVCETSVESGPLHPLCRPADTPIFTQRELDRLVYIKRTAARYTAREFQA
jgi:hypothetical protein